MKIWQKLVKKLYKRLLAIAVEETDKEAIEFYFSQVIQLGIGATVGGKLPDEGFYY